MLIRLFWRKLWNRSRVLPGGPILGPLPAFSMLILPTLFLQALYGTAGSQIMQTVTGPVSSFFMGTTALFGQNNGAGKREEGGQIIVKKPCLPMRRTVGSPPCPARKCIFLVNCYKFRGLFLCAMHKFLVSLPLAFSKQKTKMMAQKLGAALPFVCPNPQL